MSDLKKLGMTALIALYNSEAAAKGKPEVTEFKTTQAARDAIEALRADAAPAETEASGAEVKVPAGDNSKYVSTGKRGPNQGVGAFCKELIQAGKTNAEVLAEVTIKFPTAKTSKGCVAYYRTALSNAAKKAAKKAAAPAEAAPAVEAPVAEEATV